jgi:hypothetical protein
VTEGGRLGVGGELAAWNGREAASYASVGGSGDAWRREGSVGRAGLAGQMGWTVAGLGQIEKKRNRKQTAIWFGPKWVLGCQRK